jgi:hypothetical protein
MSLMVYKNIDSRVDQVPRVLNKEVELPLDASPDPSISQQGDVPDDQ